MNSSPPHDLRIRQLVEAAERAFAAGRESESESLLFQAQREAPAHPLVINQTGLRELRQGRSEQARELFERAVAADPRNLGARINLATALGDLGRNEEELGVLDEALTLEPRYLRALLQKGGTLERLGRTRLAASVYHDALLSIPSGAKLPAFLAPSLEHAQALVKKNLAELEAHVESRLAVVRSRFDAAEQQRFNHCIDAALGKRRIYHSEPTFLHFPKLPELEFHPRDLFPWLADLEAATATIRDEFLAARTDDEAGFKAYLQHAETQPLGKLAPLNKSTRWSVYYLWREGRAIEDHQSRCPRTTELLSRIPRLDVPGAGPTVFFSMLQPRTSIPGHVGVTNSRLIVHLPLVIPSGCRFRVGSDTRPWVTGTAWVFDDTIDHEAWNDSDDERAILIFDVWNPFMTEAERELFRVASGAIRDFSEESIGRARWDT